MPQLGKNMLLGQHWNYQAESACAEIKLYPKISELDHSDKSPKPEKLGKLRPMEGKLYIITLLVNVSSKTKVSWLTTAFWCNSWSIVLKLHSSENLGMTPNLAVWLWRNVYTSKMRCKDNGVTLWEGSAAWNWQAGKALLRRLRTVCFGNSFIRWQDLTEATYAPLKNPKHPTSVQHSWRRNDTLCTSLMEVPSIFLIVQPRAYVSFYI